MKNLNIPKIIPDPKKLKALNKLKKKNFTDINSIPINQISKINPRLYLKSTNL
jgi:hypothetical protein